VATRGSRRCSASPGPRCGLAALRHKSLRMAAERACPPARRRSGSRRLCCQSGCYWGSRGRRPPAGSCASSRPSESPRSAMASRPFAGRLEQSRCACWPCWRCAAGALVSSCEAARASFRKFRGWPGCRGSAMNRLQSRGAKRLRAAARKIIY
jgi:hypothetical protein